MKTDLGDNLRLWRERLNMSLEAAAHGIEILAKARGISSKSKKIPRTHASLSRWETGVVEPKEVGMILIAELYGVSVEQLRRPPPPPGSPRTRNIEVPDEHAHTVEAFIEAIERKAG